MPCFDLGSQCTNGTETCCGKTYDSFLCECIAADNSGRLQYDACIYTDACYAPSCCFDGPPVGMPPPARGTCDVGIGQPCDTGIDEDYCCVDYWSLGEEKYCTKSGGLGSADVAVGMGQTPTAPNATTLDANATSSKFQSGEVSKYNAGVRLSAISLSYLATTMLSDALITLFW